jgi:hypothetical protein
MSSTPQRASRSVSARASSWSTKAWQEPPPPRHSKTTSTRSSSAEISGDEREGAFRPALVELEEALSPGFIIEELDDGRYTVLVPSVPTPAAGALFILPRERVHPVNVPFTQAVKVISKWGAGAGELARGVSVRS